MRHEDTQLTVRDLYPDFSEDQLAEAEKNLRRFAAILLRVYERTKAEGLPWAAPESEKLDAVLTEPADGSTIPNERSTSSI